MSTMPDVEVLVTLGVDTHADAHVAAASDHLGRELGTLTIPRRPGGSASSSSGRLVSG